MSATPARPMSLGRKVFNAFAFVTILAGIGILAIRFTRGLGATTNLSQPYPWGLWIGFDVLCGVALAAGGYVLGSAVYLFGLERYRPILRAAVLTGFLGYFFVVVAILCDLGRPWRIVYPVFYSYGVASVMFLIAWHVFLYTTDQFIEFSPVICQWLGLRRLQRWAEALTVGAVIVGVILSTLHQSALGALFLIAPTKLHPLWYTELIPILFFVSSIIAGLAMVIFESSVSHRLFAHRADPNVNLDELVIGLGRGAAVALFCYFWLKWIGVARERVWSYLWTPMGAWFLVEVLGFVLLPCLLFVWATRRNDASTVRVAAVWTIIGIIINRLNISIIAFRWGYPERYLPHWMELVVTAAIVMTGIVTFRWIVEHMPVLKEDEREFLAAERGAT